MDFFKKIRKLTLLLLFLLSSFPLQAQMYYNNGRQLCCGDSLLVGSHRALGINPASLGRSGTLRKSFGLLQFGGSYFTDGLDLGGLLKLSFTDDTLTNDFKEEWLGNISEGEPFIFSSNLEIEWLSFSIASEMGGGLAFSLKDRISSFSNIPAGMLSLLLAGQESPVYQQLDQLSAAGNGTRLFYSHIREGSLGYGRKVFKNEHFGLFAGVTVKKLWGIGYFRTNIIDGVVAGLSSFSNLYRINYGQISLEKNLERKLLDASGGGMGYDFGLAANIGKSLHVSIAVIDIGKLNWSRQVLGASTSFSTFTSSLNGGLINSANFSEELEGIYHSFDFAESASFETPLSTQLRFNTLYRTGPRLAFSTDLIFPLKENNENVLNYQPTTFTAALSWNALPGIVNISSGFFYSEPFGFRLPLGISLGIFNRGMFSISTADLLTFLIDSRNPYAGISITALNYKF